MIVFMENHYNTLNQHYKDKYGKKVLKLALGIGTTCPNRDGTIAYGGCTFCASGSGHFASSSADLDIDQRLEEAKALLKNKTLTDTAYIAYLQSYTNTYGDFHYLKDVYYKLASRDDIVEISIATRPDCLPPEILDLLAEVNRIKPISIELGLQTIHESTAEKFNRGFKTEVFYKAVHDLKAIGLDVIVHLIFGLPGESKEQMLETVEAINLLPIDGLKLQVLHVLKGTQMAKQFHQTEFHLFEEEEWYDFLSEILPRIRPDIIIHRLTGDGPKASLIGPLWTGNKRQVLNKMKQRFKAKNIKQGSQYNAPRDLIM